MQVLFRLMKSYEEALVRIEENPEDPTIQQQLFDLQQRLDDENAWEASTNAKTILSKLGLHDLTKKVGLLSGGQKKACCLSSSAD